MGKIVQNFQKHTWMILVSKIRCLNLHSPCLHISCYTCSSGGFSTSFTNDYANGTRRACDIPWLCSWSWIWNLSNLNLTGWTTYNSWLAFWNFRGFYLPKKRDEKDVQKVWIRYFSVLHHQQSRYKEKLSYSVPTTTPPYICPVDGVHVAHRNIGFRLFVHRFRLAFWLIKSFEIWNLQRAMAILKPASVPILVSVGWDT